MVKIAKFTALGRSDVAEQLNVSWEEWLDYLASEPAEDFTSQMDHGGWSPVVFDPPKRARDNVKEVYGLVLDHDKGGDWDALRALWRESLGVIYTTKSHGVHGSRMRVVLAMSRPVTVAEYARIWEWAAKLSADAGVTADPQCKDPSRFWYDTTRPPGGWRAERINGALVDVDAVLALVEQPKLRVVKPKPTPTESDRERRAAAYLDKIPGAISGQSGHTATFNAVAAIMYGFDLDESTTRRLIIERYNPRCSPPWTDKEIDHKIASVSDRCERDRGYLLVDRVPVHTIQQAADHAPEVPTELDVDWTSLLLVKKDRSPKRGYSNVLTFVRHHPDFRGKWSLNTMTGEIWFDGKPMIDTFVHDIRAKIDQRLGFSPGRDDVDAAIATSANDRPFHPVQQYLRSVDWDGEPRLRAMARDYLGTDSELHAQLVAKWMISAVARAMRPGCKVDTALMLYGPQGYFKSTFFALLAGTWHADSAIDITNKDSFQQIHAAWVYEFAELENVVTGRAESRLKAWLTSTHDMFRAPYQRAVTRKPRSCVICGTTNRQRFLTDDTGSRRFWIIPVGQIIPRDLLEQMRDQLWAEAVCAYESGETWWLDRELDDQRELANEDFGGDQDPWTDAIEEWVASPTVDRVGISDLLTHAVKLEVARQDRWAEMRAARVLVTAGWERKRFTEGGRRVWKYTRRGS